MHLYVQSNEIYLLSFFIHGKQLVHPSCILIACVASVSNRVIARKLEREQKKVEGGGGGEKRKRLPVSFVPLPLPLPLHSFFCSRPNFLDKLARKRLLRRLVY